MMLSLIWLASCTDLVSETAICTGLEPPLDNLVTVVLDEGTDNVILATEGFVAKFEAGCG